MIIAIRATIGLGLVALIISRAKLGELRLTVGPPLILGILGALLALLGTQSFSALRWRLLLGEDAPPWSYLLRLYLVGAFFSLFLPTSVGGDAVRIVAASRNLPRSGEVAASVVIDRMLGVFALAVYLVIGLLVAPSVLAAAGTHLGFNLSSRKVLVLAAAGFVALALAVVAVRRMPRLRQALDEARTLVSRLLQNPGLTVRAAALGLVVQALYITAYMSLSWGMGMHLSPGVFLVCVPLVSLSAMLPITLSGLGLREGAWLLLLRPYVSAPATIVAFSLLYFGCFTMLGIAGGVLFIARGTDLSARSPAGSPVEPLRASQRG